MKVIIIGGGLVGAHIAKLLIQNKFDVKIIENRLNVYAKLKEDIHESHLVLGEGTSHTILEACDIANTDMVVAVTGADETNLVVSTLAKFEYGVPRVMARVNNPKNEWLFQHGMGVDVHLNQADIMAHMIMEEMNLGNLMQLMNLNKSAYSIVKIYALFNSYAIGKAIKELKLPQDSLLVAINRNNQVILPKGDQIIECDDEIIALVHEDQSVNFSKLFQ